ncbi:MAG: BamA/TamA family outer membrane protein [Candidatus Binatia bacterium]
MKRGLAVAVVAVMAAPAAALASWDNIENERTLIEILQEKRLEDAIERGDSSKRDVSPEEMQKERQEQLTPEEAGQKKGRFAILPEIGFSPEKGANGGIKVTDRNFMGLTVDLSAAAAMNGQYKGKFSVVHPDLADEWVILLVGAEFRIDPTKEYFGLGNNEVGPDELSTHEHQLINAKMALGLRLTRRFTLVGSFDYNEVQVHDGDRKDEDGEDIPFTEELFPNLRGIGGGKTSPVSVALIFNDRDDVTRPVKGWSIIAKYQRSDEWADNRFEFQRYIFEASYLYPLFTRRQVIGVRAGGEYMEEHNGPLPFFELASLGGGDDLRGYFQDRFIGKAKFIAGGEYRLKLLDFDFFDIWHVKIDGVGFGDVARVFLDDDEVQEISGEGAAVQPDTNDDVRISYGGGVRFALGQAIIARIDVGFSEEESGLVYLVFGHTF